MKIALFKNRSIWFYWLQLKFVKSNVRDRRTSKR